MENLQVILEEYDALVTFSIGILSFAVLFAVCP